MGGRRPHPFGDLVAGRPVIEVVEEVIMQKNGKAKLFSIATVVIAVFITVWQATAQYGWFGVNFGEFSFLFWMFIAIWLVSVAAVLRWAKKWWILITLPVILFPVWMSAVVVVKCVRGNCF